jgi:hypothetical protein
MLDSGSTRITTDGVSAVMKKIGCMQSGRRALPREREREGKGRKVLTWQI